MLQLGAATSDMSPSKHQSLYTICPFSHSSYALSFFPLALVGSAPFLSPVLWLLNVLCFVVVIVVVFLSISRRSLKMLSFQFQDHQSKFSTRKAKATPPKSPFLLQFHFLMKWIPHCPTKQILSCVVLPHALNQPWTSARCWGALQPPIHCAAVGPAAGTGLRFLPQCPTSTSEYKENAIHVLLEKINKYIARL